MLYETIKRAIDVYGEDMQKNVAIEEMSELIKEICKDKRGLSSKVKISEEIADVEIMLEQLKIIYDVHASVEAFKDKKIYRLFKRLEIASPRK